MNNAGDARKRECRPTDGLRTKASVGCDGESHNGLLYSDVCCVVYVILVRVCSFDQYAVPQRAGSTSATVCDKVQRCPAKSSAVYFRSPYTWSAGNRAPPSAIRRSVGGDQVPGAEGELGTVFPNAKPLDTSERRGERGAAGP